MVLPARPLLLLPPWYSPLLLYYGLHHTNQTKIVRCSRLSRDGPTPSWWNALSVIINSISERDTARIARDHSENAIVLGVWGRLYRILFSMPGPSGPSRGRQRLRSGFLGMSRAYISFRTFALFGREPLISAHSHNREVTAALGKRDVA